MKRINLHHLRTIVDVINELARTPPDTFERKGTSLMPQHGNYHLDECNGGVALCQMCSAGSGRGPLLSATRTIIDRGTKRELYGQLRAFRDGMLAGRQKATDYLQGLEAHVLMGSGKPIHCTTAINSGAFMKGRVLICQNS